MKPQSTDIQDAERSQWFDHLVATLRTHEIQLETGTASREIEKFYEHLLGNNLDELLKENKRRTQQHFVSKIIVDFLSKLDNKLPNKLAFDFNDAEVLVWAEIDDNDEKQEKVLARAESSINAAFHEFGFDMELMIVEKSDNLPIPNHYRVFKA